MNDKPKLEVKEEKQAEQKPAYTHRYVHEACSNVGFYWTEQGVTPNTKFPVMCVTCLNPIGKIKPENFIKL